MKRLRLISLLLTLVCLPLAAQQMSMEDFTRLKGRHVEKDPAMALLDLVTQEKGFTVLGNGNKPVEVQEQDGFIRLLLPHKTTHLTLQHPDYGQLAWMAPKPLKKNRHYQASLYVLDPTRDFKATHQWALFRFDPDNLLLQIDSVSCPVRGSIMEYYLPVGEHQYKAEAPFYEPLEGTFTLSDSVRTDISVELRPLYSFLTVKADWKGGELYIDGARIRREEATSYRLVEGYHRVAYFWASECFYDSLLYVGKAQKKILSLTARDLRPLPIKKGDARPMLPQPSQEDTVAVRTPVKLTCKDPQADILVDRECMGQGQWEGSLPLGFHLLSARKDGQEGQPTRLMLKDNFPQEVELMAPGTSAGLVNIHCNVEDVRILVDGVDCGTAPRILQLDASHNYEVILYKPGYKDKKCRVRPRSNQQVDLYVKMKKR